MKHYLICLFSYLLIIPGGIICYAPMREQLRYSEKKIYTTNFLLFLLTAPISAFAEYKADFGHDIIFMAYCLLLYLLYHRTLFVSHAKSLMIFLSTMVWMSYSANFTVLIDRRIHPDGPLDYECISAVIQLIISIVMTALIFYPLQKYGSRLLLEFNDGKVWLLGCNVSMLFIIINIFIVPQKYETLRVNNVLRAFVFVVTMTFILHSLLCLIFYFTISGLIRSKKAEEEIKLYAMRESCYIKQQRYIDENSRIRHDFKHTIRTLKELADYGKYQELTKYIDQFFDTLPENETIYFCKNYAANAVLNYYNNLAEQYKIETNWKIDIPENLAVRDVDLCSVIGNILENAITASRDIPEEKRMIQFTVVTRHNTNLYIVATNNFNGKVRLNNDRYISTHRDGSGIGLASIVSIAESYGGAADFRHNEKQFFTNVMLTADNNSR